MDNLIEDFDSMHFHGARIDRPSPRMAQKLQNEREVDKVLDEERKGSGNFNR